MHQFASDIAFTPAVKAIQSRKGSRSVYSRVERGKGWQTKVTPELAAFLSELDMFYLGTANADGQPYIQYRGGSPGFLKVMDDKTWALPTSPATNSTSPWATSRIIQRRSSS